jgi:PAS domain-containing protein
MFRQLWLSGAMASSDSGCEDLVAPAKNNLEYLLQLQSTILELEAAMWNSKIPVLVFDSESRRIAGLNEAAAALFKTASEALTGQLVDWVVIPEERERLAEMVASREPQWGDVGAWQCLARDGSRFVASIRYHQAIQEGRLVHIVLATRVVHMESARSAAASSGDALRTGGEHQPPWENLR